MYLEKSVILALIIIITIEGNIPTLPKAIGHVKTPLPTMVASRLNMTEVGNDFRLLRHTVLSAKSLHLSMVNHNGAYVDY